MSRTILDPALHKLLESGAMFLSICHPRRVSDISEGLCGLFLLINGRAKIEQVSLVNGIH